MKSLSLKSWVDRLLCRSAVPPAPVVIEEAKPRTRKPYRGQARPRKGHIYKGVYRDKVKGVWRAKLYLGSKRKYLGNYATAPEAARAYDRAAYAQWGDDAFLNFPEEIKGETPASDYTTLQQLFSEEFEDDRTF